MFLEREKKGGILKRKGENDYVFVDLTPEVIKEIENGSDEYRYHDRALKKLK